ncbi:MAG: hypothetical protein Q9170_006448 [Blastenia crenularia]
MSPQELRSPSPHCDGSCSRPHGRCLDYNGHRPKPIWPSPPSSDEKTPVQGYFDTNNDSGDVWDAVLAGFTPTLGRGIDTHGPRPDAHSLPPPAVPNKGKGKELEDAATDAAANLLLKLSNDEVQDDAAAWAVFNRCRDEINAAAVKAAESLRRLPRMALMAPPRWRGPTQQVDPYRAVSEHGGKDVEEEEEEEEEEPMPALVSNRRARNRGTDANVPVFHEHDPATYDAIVQWCKQDMCITGAPLAWVPDPDPEKPATLKGDPDALRKARERGIPTYKLRWRKPRWEEKEAEERERIWKDKSAMWRVRAAEFKKMEEERRRREKAEKEKRKREGFPTSKRKARAKAEGKGKKKVSGDVYNEGDLEMKGVVEEREMEGEGETLYAAHMRKKKSALGGNCAFAMEDVVPREEPMASGFTAINAGGQGIPRPPRHLLGAGMGAMPRAVVEEKEERTTKVGRKVKRVRKFE